MWTDALALILLAALCGGWGAMRPWRDSANDRDAGGCAACAVEGGCPEREPIPAGCTRSRVERY